MANLVTLLFVCVMTIAALASWRAFDRRRDDVAWHGLAGTSENSENLFDIAQIADLPEPAQRYFRYCIKPGTPLHQVVELEMSCNLGLGSSSKPKYRSFFARQILAPPNGLVWRTSSRYISGSDGLTPNTSWTRFWLFGLLPIVRVGGEIDNMRSAFGRVIAEGAFWAPASLLPSDNVQWEGVDDSTARASVTFGQLQQSVDITVLETGQPTRVTIQRWSNVNPKKQYQLQPFGGDLFDFKNVEGYRLPTRVEGGNHIGTPDYFPFYKARVTSIHFVT